MVRLSLCTLAAFTGAIPLVSGFTKFYGDHYSPQTISSSSRISGGEAAASPDPLPLRPLKDWDLKKSLTKKAKYSINEATWVNVDISPDGKELIFDVLGDIYTLPAKGGKAKPFLTGPAFEVQPKYSKDGKKIIFTSDRSGIDNLWMVDRDGKSNLQPVSQENYRFVSNGQLSPKGDSVLGVKWFTSTRSIPAGTIVRYNLTSNSAEELIGYKSKQVGVEEPAFDPINPNIIYYSTNDADSEEWEYNKDPHKGIFNIYTYNTKTKDKSYITGGVGGAARPTPSRDGKYLAFVRRVEFTWALVVRELETGNEKIIFDSLSRDNQETSATNGVYPRFAWTPENNSIIIWAKGKLWNIPVDESPIKEIPFEVDVNLDIAETVRPKVDLIKFASGQSFKSTTVKYYDVSSDERKVVYIVAGKTYVKNLRSDKITELKLPRSEPNRYSPSFHPTNSNIIIQGVWSDKTMSSIEIVDINTHKVIKTLDLPPGRYDFPTLSKDGSLVSFSKSAGDAVSGDSLYTTKPGLYIAQLDSSFQVKKGSIRFTIPGESTKATFTSGNSKLKIGGGLTSSPYFFDLSSNTTQSSGTVKDALSSNDLTEDGSHIVFSQYHHVYLAPASNSEDTVYWTKPGYAPKGTIRLTEDGGELPFFAQGTKKVYYVLGSILYEADSASIFTACSAIALTDTEKYGFECVKPLLKKHDLSVSLNFDKPCEDDVFVLDNAVIVTMATGKEQSDVLRDGRLVVRGNRIEAVGRSWDVKIPYNAKVYNLNGGVVVPGFIDAHAHWDSPQFPVNGHWQQQLQLAYGVTTSHNPSYDNVDNYAEQDYQRSGRLLSPRIFGTGSILYGAEGSYKVEINNLDDALSAIRRHKAYGAFSVKSYNQPARSARQMILEAARQLNFAVVPEGGMNTFWNTNHLIDGHTTLEHSIHTGIIYDDLIKLFVKTGTAWTPTLIVAFGGPTGEEWFYQNTNVWEEKKLRNFHPYRPLERASFRKVAADDKDYVHFETARSAHDIYKQGGLINPGAHGQRQGIGYHWELNLFAQGNFTSYEVLKVATSNPAKSLGLKGIGQIKPGFLADFNIYKALNSPLKNIKNSKFIDKVVLNGNIYDAATLAQEFPFKKPAPSTPIFNTEVVKHKN